MQILGVAGKAGSGKTALCHHMAHEILETYGCPVLLSYAKFGSLPGINKLFEIHREREFARLDKGGNETLILIEDVHFPQQVEQIHEWGGVVLFVCADGRLETLESWPEKEDMAYEYTVGKSTDIFDFCITNHKDEETFKSEITKFMYVFLGGDASYEADLF